MKPRDKYNVRKIADLLTDDPDIIEAKTKKAAHRPDAGTDYDEFKSDGVEFSDLKDRAQSAKDKPGEGKDAKIKPGDGAKSGAAAPSGGPKPAKGDKKYSGGPSNVTGAKELTKKGKDPVKKKATPGTSRDNRTEKDGKPYPKGGKATLSNEISRALNSLAESGQDAPSQGHFAAGGVEANELGDPTSQWDGMDDVEKADLLRKRAALAARKMKLER